MFETSGQFTIELNPADPLIEATGRFDFTKSWTGAIDGTSTGLMLSAGVPSTGNAGYVALEVFAGTVDGKQGGFALIQRGLMTAGDAQLSYDIAPGSGTGELTGITGQVELTVEEGQHYVMLRYDLSD